MLAIPTCDFLLTNALVLTVDDRLTVYTPGVVAVSGDSIVHVGGDAEGCQAGEVVDCRGRVLMPGLVNAHTHAAMTLMRGMADDLPLLRWPEDHIWPTEMKHVSPQFVKDGTLLACAEMLRGGVTCFNDMYFFPEAALEAALEAGIRASLGMIVVEFPSAYASDPDDSRQTSRDSRRHLDGRRRRVAAVRRERVQREPHGLSS